MAYSAARDVSRAFSLERVSTASCGMAATGRSRSGFLGIISGDRAVALYSLANKAALGAFGLLSPAVRVVFPRASLLFGRSLQEQLRINAIKG
jgi:hypothetical protein